jgi:hypothetical protein
MAREGDDDAVARPLTRETVHLVENQTVSHVNTVKDA